MCNCDETVYHDRCTAQCQRATPTHHCTSVNRWNNLGAVSGAPRRPSTLPQNLHYVAWPQRSCSTNNWTMCLIFLTWNNKIDGDILWCQWFVLEPPSRGVYGLLPHVRPSVRPSVFTFRPTSPQQKVAKNSNLVEIIPFARLFKFIQGNMENKKAHRGNANTAYWL